jgi:hypothetical protein
MSTGVTTIATFPPLQRRFSAAWAFHSAPQPAAPRYNNVSEASRAFLNATLARSGTDYGQVTSVLSWARQHQALEKLDAVILQRRGLAEGPHPVASILAKEFYSNPVSAWWKQAKIQEVMDTLQTGAPTYRQTPWDYRRFGMWKCLADFFSICKRHPLVSSIIIALVGYYGGKYPFIGGFSGAIIMGLSALGLWKSERLARQVPGPMGAAKAEHYITSGENLADFLLTAFGADGIAQSCWQGGKVFLSPLPKARAAWQMHTPVAWLRRLWRATTFQLTNQARMNAFQSFRFVIGLFDNVIMPFNWAAEKIQHNEASMGQK